MEAWHKRTPFLQNIPQWLLLRLFSFRIEEGRRAFEEEVNEFLQRDIKENSNNLEKNQQVTVNSIASVMKTPTSSCCSSKSQILNKSNSGSREWINNEIIELIAVREDFCNTRHPDYSVKQKRNNDM